MSEKPGLPGIDEVRSYLSRFNFFARYVHGPEEGEVYVRTHSRRFVETLHRFPLLPDRPRILELGAVPYSMTILLRRYLQAEVSTLSFYEVEGPQRTHVLESPDGAERYEFAYTAVNIERDLFPFEDALFDLVLCCEILEHLLINPSHMLFETHRVLRPGGYFVLTTPNVVRAENLTAMLQGRNINDAYHGNGIYGRHNREYAPAEVPQLLEACGYSIVSHDTMDVYDSSPPDSAKGREDTIVTVGQATGRRRVGTPPNLYVLMDEYHNVVRPAFTMGIDDVGHLGPGWYDLEADGELGFRWMQRTATFHLSTTAADTIGVHVQAHHPDLSQQPVRVTLSVGGFTVAQVIQDHRWQNLEFRLPQSINGPVTIELTLDRDWVPADTSASSDRRRLGLRMHRCWSR
jgi:SAM-dependent methyltransferase